MVPRSSTYEVATPREHPGDPEPRDGHRRSFRVVESGGQHGQERALRNLDAADLLHAPLARLLALEQLALAGDVAPVALGDVLAVGLDGLAGDDVRPPAAPDPALRAPNNPSV